MVRGLNYIPEHVLGRETKNSPSMGPTGAHLSQRHTLTTGDKDFRQFLSVLTFRSLMFYLDSGGQEGLMEFVTWRHLLEN